MKNKSIIAVIIAFLAIVAFSSIHKDRPSAHPYTYECEKPLDIPDTLGTGEKVNWDCEWHGKYNNGDVKVYYNEDGTTKAIMIMSHE